MPLPIIMTNLSNNGQRFARPLELTPALAMQVQSTSRVALSPHMLVEEQLSSPAAMLIRSNRERLASSRTSLWNWRAAAVDYDF